MKIYDEKNKRMIKDKKEIEQMNITKSLTTGKIVNSKNEVMEHLIDYSKYPHCYGEMTWINKYKEGEVPREAICDGCYSGSCIRITREIYESQHKEGEEA